LADLTYAEVAEGVRATIAAYTHALEDGRSDDVVATIRLLFAVEWKSSNNSFNAARKMRKTSIDRPLLTRRVVRYFYHLASFRIYA